jgi:hypothetical protein
MQLFFGSFCMLDVNNTAVNKLFLAFILKAETNDLLVMIFGMEANKKSIPINYVQNIVC